MRNALVLLAVIGVASPVYADDPKPAGSGMQQAPEQKELRSFGYARLGYGGAFGDRFHPAPAIGFGYRGELDSFAMDVSFLNFVIKVDPYGGGRDVFAGSTLKLQALRFLNGEAEGSAYVGGGLSWGVVNVGRGSSTAISYVNSWHGSGLQGELTAGYEVTRRSPMRLFIQADIGLPFFKAKGDSFTFISTPPGVFRPETVEERYMPSAVVSLGIGWQRPRNP